MSFVLCHQDSYLRELATQVVSCTEEIVAPAAPAKAKKGKAEEKNPQTPVKQYNVILAETIMYPEGGGQPADCGFIGEVPVTHVFHNAEGQVVHRTSQPVTAGEQVTVKLDWQRRFDHMQQHSGQHLISAVFVKLFNYPTHSWWLATYPTECFVELDAKEVSEEQLQEAERVINEEIRAAHATKTHLFASAEQASEVEYFRSKPNELKDIQGPVRVIEIPGVDFNKCCGTHVNNTAHLQLIHLTRTEKTRGHTRVFFLAGQRAQEALAKGLVVQRQLVSLLSVGPEQHAETVKKLQLDLKQANKDTRTLQKELSSLLAASLASSPSPFIATHRANADLSFCTEVVDAVLEQTPDKLVFASCSMGEEKEGQFLLGGPDELVSKHGPQVAKILEGRGGGRKGRYQGKASRVDKREEVTQYLADAFKQ